jgi:hypothetical protein
MSAGSQYLKLLPSAVRLGGALPSALRIRRDFLKACFQNLSLGIEGFLGRWRNHNVFREQIRRTKEPLYPVILLATHIGTLIFSGFFGRESGPKNKRPLLRFFEHPPCPRPRSVTEKRLQRFNWTRADALESIPVALQSRFSALRISST